MAHTNKSSARIIEVPLSFRRGSGWSTQLVKIRDQGSREADNKAAIEHAIQKLGYSESDVQPFLTGDE